MQNVYGKYNSCSRERIFKGSHNSHIMRNVMVESKWVSQIHDLYTLARQKQTSWWVIQNQIFIFILLFSFNSPKVLPVKLVPSTRGFAALTNTLRRILVSEHDAGRKSKTTCYAYWSIRIVSLAFFSVSKNIQNRVTMFDIKRLLLYPKFNSYVFKTGC